MASVPSPIFRLLEKAALGAIQLRPLLPTYFHLLLSAVFPIYAGAHASLSRPSSAAKPEKKKAEPARNKDDDSDDEDEDVIVQKMEGLSPSDAIMFPLMAGATLAALYFIIKWLKDPALLNKILRYYFSQLGLFFSIRFLKDTFTILRSLVFPNAYTARGSTWKVNTTRRHFERVDTDASKKLAEHRIQCSPLPGFLSRIHFSKPVLSGLWSAREYLYTKATLRLHVKNLFTLKYPVDVLDVASTLLSVGLSIYSIWVPNPWYLTNFFGFAFCYGSLQFMSPTTFWTGTLILSSLFLYDIYFVFFTPLMVTVATKLDVPIKLLFPRPPAPDAPADTLSLAMLGLGDIVIPGMVVGLALRFDLYLHYLRKQITDESSQKTSTTKASYKPATGQWGERFWTRSASDKAAIPLNNDKQEIAITSTKFPKPYFTAGVVGYLSGMMVTLVIMQVADHPQPALLYLVPGVLGSLWSTAFVRGEIKEMWDFNEDENEVEGKSSDSEGKNEDENVLDTLKAFLGFSTRKAQQPSEKTKDEKTKSEQNTDGNEKGQASDGQDRKEAKDEKEKKKGSKRKDNSRQLIGFSIDLPKESKSGSINVKETETDEPNGDSQATSLLSASAENEAAAASSTGIEVANDQVETIGKRTRIAQHSIA